MTPIKPTSELVVAFLKTLEGSLSSTSKIDLYLGGGAAVQSRTAGERPPTMSTRSVSPQRFSESWGSWPVGIRRFSG